ncbi:MAG: isocitrate lyase/phosphoenolpyruvate mutase family protein [Betaproteobacteria bacterium]
MSIPFEQNPPPADLRQGVPAGRWAGIARTCSPDDVERLRGSLRVQYTLADRGARRLWQLLQDEPHVAAQRALTGGQAVQMVRAGLKAVHVTVAGDGAHPADGVPDAVRRINGALQRADQLEHAEGRVTCDWFVPVVAGAEAGFGGPLDAFETTMAMIEAGAAAVHFEDQLAPETKRGRPRGKVLLSTGDFVRTLVAARLAADVMGVPTVLVARTDARGAELLASDADPRDREFLLEAARTAEGFFRLRGGIECAVSRACACAPYADVLWCEARTPDLAEARRFAEGVHEVHPGKRLAYDCSAWFDRRRPGDEATIAQFQRELAAMGYGLQLVTAQAELPDGARGHAATQQHEVDTAYLDLVAEMVSGEARRTACR